MTLSATDAEGVAGIEYKLLPRALAHEARVPAVRGRPSRLARRTTLIWRAVDVNGNSEATYSLRG